MQARARLTFERKHNVLGALKLKKHVWSVPTGYKNNSRIVFADVDPGYVDKLPKLGYVVGRVRGRSRSLESMSEYDILISSDYIPEIGEIILQPANGMPPQNVNSEYPPAVIPFNSLGDVFEQFYGKVSGSKPLVIYQIVK